MKEEKIKVTCERCGKSGPAMRWDNRRKQWWHNFCHTSSMEDGKAVIIKVCMACKMSEIHPR